VGAIEEDIKTVNDNCIGCMRCVKNCPMKALAGHVEGHVPIKLLPVFVGGEADDLPGLQLGRLHPRPLQPGTSVQE
ncbi:MAG: 4Fe-4S binding protein, partial [Lawsonibacter sp.]|nr:4Fe-4S binding protein [Lawsonibacter sp.]